MTPTTKSELRENIRRTIFGDPAQPLYPEDDDVDERLDTILSLIEAELTEARAARYELAKNIADKYVMDNITKSQEKTAEGKQIRRTRRWLQDVAAHEYERLAELNKGKQS